MDKSIKILKLGFFVLFCVIFDGCSHYSKNVIKTGTFSLRGGKSEETTWSESLLFNRTSWYSELTMSLDLLLAKIDAQSPFWKWLDSNEQKLVVDCSAFYVVMAYTLDSKVISHPEIKSQFEKSGFNEVLIPQFAKNLKAHPEFIPMGYQQHKIYGVCQKGPVKSIEFSLPGYLTQSL